MNLVDLKTLSERTSLSVFTIRKFIKDGMPHYRVSRKILVDLQDFEKWFQEFKCGSDVKHGDLDFLLDEALNKFR